jgi:hypothetical protein
MGARHLLHSFNAWRAAGEPLVLATVYETAGSTYSKAGHRILLAANGDYRGLVSGGCLEGDLAERARGVVATAQAVAVTYDLRDSADDLWGLGVGCNGLLRVFLQPLLPANDYQPFNAIAERSPARERPASPPSSKATGPISQSGRPPSSTPLPSTCSARTPSGRSCFAPPAAAPCRAERQGLRPSTAAAFSALRCMRSRSCSCSAVGSKDSLVGMAELAGSSPSPITGLLPARGGLSARSVPCFVEPGNLAASFAQ